jgi:Autophagy protein 16 (ATG16)
VTARDSITSPVVGDGSAQLRSDLAEALRSRGQLQLRLKMAEDELEKLKLKNKSDAKLIGDLSSERVILLTKVKDRDEELKGKTKLLEVYGKHLLTASKVREAYLTGRTFKTRWYHYTYSLI